MSTTVNVFFAVSAALAVAFSRPAQPLAEPLCFWRGADMQPTANSLLSAAASAKEHGMLVERVARGSPAARAGLKSNDVVTALDGIPVSTERSLALAIADHCCGPTVTLSVRRGHRLYKIELSSRSAPPTRKIAA